MRPPVSTNELIVVATEHYGSYFQGLGSGLMDCELVREPTNQFDANAIMVFQGKWQRGYLPASKAEKYAPALDRAGGRLETVLRTDSEHAFVNLPTPSELVEWLEQSGHLPD